MIERSQDRNNGWSALYFDGSTHGSPLTLGGCICRWPTASFPTNANDESQSLEQVRTQMKEKSQSASPCAALVIEPTQQSSGHTATNDFIKNLKSIANDFEAALIVDETGSGVHASGHGFWQYNGPADYVSFGNRTQASGYFSLGDHVVAGGNENDVKLFNIIQEGISQGNLAKLAHTTG